MTSYSSFLANETERIDRRRAVQEAREQVVVAQERVLTAVGALFEGGGTLPELTGAWQGLRFAEADLAGVDDGVD